MHTLRTKNITIQNMNHKQYSINIYCRVIFFKLFHKVKNESIRSSHYYDTIPKIIIIGSNIHY